MPKDPILQFKDFNKCVDLADVLYADIEAILEECNEPGMLRKHIPCCVGAYLVSKVEGCVYEEFKGVECMESFGKYLESLANRISERNKTATRVPAVRSDQEMAIHEEAEQCIWCKRTFDDRNSLFRKVFDHDHLTGKYRGAACQGCNNKLCQDKLSDCSIS